MAEWQKITVHVDKRYKPRERQAIGADIVELIIKRTLSGDDKNGDAFKPYSKGYTKSLDFKLAGKKVSPVNLKLSGDMLNSLEVLSHKSGEIVIGYDRKNKEMNGQVEGNRLGTYGKKKVFGKKRDFLGIDKKKELNKKILNKYPLEDKEARKLSVEKAFLLKEASESTIDVGAESNE